MDLEDFGGWRGLLRWMVEPEWFWPKILTQTVTLAWLFAVAVTVARAVAANG
jgi:hypothetical protein